MKGLSKNYRFFSNYKLKTIWVDSMKHFALLLSGFFISGLLFVNTSCQKDTDCKARVICNDSTGTAISNANVFLYAVVKDPTDPKGQATFTADVKATGNSDASGQVSFVFKLPAIYDIRATITAGTRTLVGTGIIKLEEGKTVEKTVTLKWLINLNSALLKRI